MIYNLNNAKKKLSKITTVWNDFIWEVKYLQDKINFNKEVTSNYYGDILYYFNDTIELLKANRLENVNFNDSIFNAIGFMQIIYIHQDLINELLHIFKLECSKKEDKNPNRKIRNELVGHPINRNHNNKELESSVIFGENNGKGCINYIKYESKKSFNSENISYNIEDILNGHSVFLNKYLDKILEKLFDILREYKTNLKNIKKLISKEGEFLKIVDLSERFYTYIFNYEYLFQRGNLIECYKRRNKHLRYKKAVDKFLLELSSGIEETLSNIEDIIRDNKSNNIEKDQIEEVKIIFVEDLKENISSKYKTNKNYDYYFEKLHEKKHLNILNSFEDEFKDNLEITNELDNMKNNVDNDLEYYCSYNYLRSLIQREQ